MEKPKQKVSRISVSLPDSLLDQLDEMVEKKACDSRSQAIVDMIYQQLAEFRQDVGTEIMAGTINIVYDHTVPNLQNKLADLQFRYIDEVISSLNVNLTHNQTMSVILVQGPGAKLKRIANEMISHRGVITGKLLVNAAIIPPVHPFPPLTFN